MKNIVKSKTILRHFKNNQAKHTDNSALFRPAMSNPWPACGPVEDFVRHSLVFAAVNYPAF